MASVNFAKSFIAAVLVALLIAVGYICQHKHLEATRITTQLKAYKVQVQKVQSQGRGNYYSFVVLDVNGVNVSSTLDTKIGEVGSNVTVWSAPDFSLAYTHKTQIQERAQRSWVVFFLLLTAVALALFAMFSKANNKA
jgi:hypothetical protein